jgi:hypothetical protein
MHNSPRTPAKGASLSHKAASLLRGLADFHLQQLAQKLENRAEEIALTHPTVRRDVDLTAEDRAIYGYIAGLEDAAQLLRSTPPIRIKVTSDY